MGITLMITIRRDKGIMLIRMGWAIATAMCSLARTISAMSAALGQ
ncbi:hypothetical protein RvVAR031_10580 [Agrobacterium vitis]|nr:hypothetical protein RvVAR031_10580 [Agrobacterium vitis]